MLGVRSQLLFAKCTYLGAQSKLTRGVVLFRGNWNGELGLGDVNNRGAALGQMGDALPFVSLGTGQTASALALGAYHSCALLNGGIKCWGYALTLLVYYHRARGV